MMVSVRRLLSSAGFSLVELLVVVSIVSVLAVIALPLAEVAQKRSKEEELRAALREVRSAIDAYKRAVDQGRILRSIGDSGYPPSLDVLVEGVVDAQSPQGERLYFLRRIPRDPFAQDVEHAASASWGLRSYASPPGKPESGKDVFDIRSRSDELGLNGEPYSAW